VVNFIVGDDLGVAAGVALILAVAAALVRAGFDPWWLIPLGVPLLLGWSLRRATQGDGR
jgi:hypothetical protein